MRLPDVMIQAALPPIRCPALLAPKRLDPFVYLLPVVLPRTKAVEPLVAHIALVRCGIAVVALVVPQGLHPLEPRRALIAREWLLRRVRHEVDRDLELFQKCFPTNRTRMRLLRGVQLHVISQRTGLDEPLAALVALVLELRRGAGFLMLLQGADSEESASTGRADEFPFLIRAVLVLGEVLLVEESLEADIALERADGAFRDAVLFVLIRPVGFQFLQAVEHFARATAADEQRLIRA